MMKKLIYFIWALLLLEGCSDHSDMEDATATKGYLPINVKVNTKAHTANGSQIVHPDGIIGEQHTTTAYVYIFEGGDKEAVYTGYKTDVGWSKHFTLHSDASINGLPVHTAQMRYGINYKFYENGTYTLLGIAVNEGGRKAFNVPLDFPKGCSLAEITARLQDGISSATLRDAELYVGCKEILIDKTQPEVPTLELTRRVAGIMGYFKNAPKTIYVEQKPYSVTDIRISMYTPQNISLPLVERRQKPFFEDFILSPSTDSQGMVIVNIPMDGTANDATIVKGGAYVLPADAPKRGIYTLHVDIMNNDLVLKSIRVKLPANDDLDQGQTGNGTGIIDTESAFRFPLIANHFYTLGTPAEPIDLKGNGSDIMISIDPSWKEDNNLDITERH